MNELYFAIIHVLVWMYEVLCIPCIYTGVSCVAAPLFPSAPCLALEACSLPAHFSCLLKLHPQRDDIEASPPSFPSRAFPP